MGYAGCVQLAFGKSSTLGPKWNREGRSRPPICFRHDRRQRTRRVRAKTIGSSHRLDLLWREGAYREQPRFPAQIGYEAAGMVESVGPEVKFLKVGDRVSTFPAVSLLDYTAHGETILYPESALLAYPKNLTPEQAAAANTGLFTAYFALVELACLKPNQHVVVTAASSSMGVARPSIDQSHLWQKHRRDALRGQTRRSARRRSRPGAHRRP
jgi:hypothetical protein